LLGTNGKRWQDWPEAPLSFVEVSYSKDFKKEAGILKIELLNTTKSPNRWRYSRYEEA